MYGLTKGNHIKCGRIWYYPYACTNGRWILVGRRVTLWHHLRYARNYFFSIPIERSFNSTQRCYEIKSSVFHRNLKKTFLINALKLFCNIKYRLLSVWQNYSFATNYFDLLEFLVVEPIFPSYFETFRFTTYSFHSEYKNFVCHTDYNIFDLYNNKSYNNNNNKMAARYRCAKCEYICIMLIFY